MSDFQIIEWLHYEVEAVFNNYFGRCLFQLLFFQHQAWKGLLPVSRGKINRKKDSVSVYVGSCLFRSLTLFLIPDMAWFFGKSLNKGKRDDDFVFCNSLYTLVMIVSSLSLILSLGSVAVPIYLLVYIHTWEMLKVPLTCGLGLPLKNSVSKGEKSAQYKQIRLEEEKKKADWRVFPSNDESELSKLKSEALNASDIESNPGPTSAIFQWMENFNKWSKHDQQREIIQTTVTNHVNDLHEDALEQIIPEDMYTEKNMLVLQKFQDIYLTNPEAFVNSITKDKLSDLYNTWYKKIREKEKNIDEQPKIVNLQILEQSFQVKGVHRKDFISVPVTVVVDPISGSGTKATGYSEGGMNMNMSMNMPESSQSFTLIEEEGNMDNMLTTFPTKRKRTRRTKEELKEDGFHCDFCPKIYSRKQTLNKHIKDIHSQYARITKEVHPSVIRPNSFDGETFLSGQVSGGQDQCLQELDGLPQLNTQHLSLENSVVAGIATISDSDLTLVTNDNSFNEGSIGTQNTSFSWTPCHSPGFSLENQ